MLRRPPKDYAISGAANGLRCLASFKVSWWLHKADL